MCLASFSAGSEERADTIMHLALYKPHSMVLATIELFIGASYSESSKLSRSPAGLAPIYPLSLVLSLRRRENQVVRTQKLGIEIPAWPRSPSSNLQIIFLVNARTRTYQIIKQRSPNGWTVSTASHGLRRRPPR